MYDTIIERLTTWNRKMNGIPRKCMLIAITLLVMMFTVMLVPYCWPFMLGMAFSMLLDPVIKRLPRRLGRLRIGRSVATLLGMVVLFGLVGFLFAIAVNRLWRELMGLVRAVPAIINWLSTTVIPWASDLYSQYQDVLPPSVMVVVNNAISSVGQAMASWAASLSAMLTSGAWATAMSIVDVVLAVVLTIMGTYYFTADRERIGKFLKRTFPHHVREHSALLKANLISSLFGQIKSQLTVSMIIIVFLVVVFVCFGIQYGLLAALIIGVADALPVVGAGLFLIPWSILGFVLGDMHTGVVMAGTYVGTIVLRQIFEPRIVGKNLGLYPLATMVAMYAGYQAFGFLGLLGGPVMLNVIKVVLQADRAAAGEADAQEKTPEQRESSEMEQKGQECVTQNLSPTIPNPEGEVSDPKGRKIPFRKKS